MTLNQFRLMDENEQLNFIWNSYEPVAERRDSYYRILLYQIDNFYIEVYHHSHFNVMIKLESFEDTSLLEPYFENISLANLLAC
jgi:hypothetical protein